MPDDALLPCDDISSFVEGGANGVVIHRTIVAGLHIVLARPDQLDRCGALDRFGDISRLAHEVGRGIGAPAEAAAGKDLVDLDLLRFKSDRLRNRALVDRMELLAVPYLATVGA